MERIGDKNYSSRYGHDNFVTSKIQFTVGYDYYICHFLPNWFFQFNKWEIVRYNSNTLGDRHSFFYITFAVHAIENEQKALRTAYLFVAAYAITLIGSFSSFNESPNFSTMIVEDIITGDNSIEEWTNRTVASSAPYTILMNMFMLTGLFYPLQSINKRFNASWRLAIAAQLCSTISVLSILIANNFNIFSIFNNISGVLAFILIVILFFKGGKTESTHGNIISLQTPTPSPQVHNDIPSKSEELTKLKSLLDAGVLTQEEFDIEKKKILNS